MTESLLAGHVTVIFGEARFVGPRQVVVEAQRGGTDAVQVAIEASNVVINTGSAPRPGGVPGADLPLVHDSISIQHLSDLPRRLVVVGAGAVGLEFAQMFAGFGSQVTLLSRGTVLADEDADMRASVLAVLTDSGVEVVEGANVAKVTASGVVTAQSTGSETIEADAVLFAVGRVPVVPAAERDLRPGLNGHDLDAGADGAPEVSCDAARTGP